MGLPQQVQRQADAAEQFDKMVASEAAAQPTDGEQAPSAAQAEEQSTPGESGAELDTLRQRVVELAARLDDENNPTFKSRWMSLQGMYNSQVPQLQQQVKQLTDQLAAMQAQQAEPRQQESDLITKTDEEAFGSDLIDMARRVAKDELRRQAAAYDERISKLTEELQSARRNVDDVVSSHTQSRQEQFVADLTKQLPKWRELQETPECQEFLGTHIPGTRTEWDAALKDAASRLDLQAVVEVFDQFFAKHPKYAPKTGAPQPKQQPNRAELARQVTPSKTGSQAPSAASGKRMYTGAEYEQESMRIIRLAQQGKHDDAAKLEAELNTALMEGRVR